MESKKVSNDAKKKLASVKRLITSSKRTAKKVMARAEKQARADFDNAERKMNRQLDQALQVTLATAQKVNDTAKRMGAKMSVKEGEVKRKIGVITGALPTITADVNTFSKDASAELGAMQTEINSDM